MASKTKDGGSSASPEKTTGTAPRRRRSIPAPAPAAVPVVAPATEAQGVPVAPLTAPLAAPLTLTLGSDVDVAKLLLGRLRTEHRDHVVYDGGSIYGWAGTHWQAVRDVVVRKAIHALDGMEYGDPEKPRQLKLSKTRIDSILFEASVMLDEEEGFFANAPTGINCASGFLLLSSDGAELVPHVPEQRQRHVIPGRWRQEDYDGCSDFALPGDSHLHMLMGGCFLGDVDAAEKVTLVQELAGVAMGGFSTKLKKPRFFLFNGPLANNGKSQVLDMMSTLLPQTAVASISVEKWNEDSYLVKLKDKLFNRTAELSGSSIKSDVFKQVVTGDELTARDLYRSASEFRPVALHVAATNKLPSFEGGFDRGILRRLMPLDFNRTIPDAEAVEGIGKLIGTKEADLLLAWAVEGAKRVLANGDFTIPASCRKALDEWSQEADPILGWMAAQVKVTGDAKDMERASDALASFKEWAAAQGHHERVLPGPKAFWNRVFAAGGGKVAKVHKETGSHYTGLRVVGGVDTHPDDAATAARVTREEEERIAHAKKEAVLAATGPHHRNAHWHKAEPAEAGSWDDVPFDAEDVASYRATQGA